MKRDFNLQQFRAIISAMSPDDLQEAGTLIAEHLPSSKRTEFFEAIKRVGSSDEQSDLKLSDGEKSDDNLARKGLDDSSESGEP